VFRVGTLTTWDGTYSDTMGLNPGLLTRRFAGIVNVNYSALWAGVSSLISSNASVEQFMTYFVVNGLPPALSSGSINLAASSNGMQAY
jgi:hypothetical protein